MKMYELPRDTKVVLRDLDGNVIRLKFDYIDGAYAKCALSNGTPINIAAWTEVELDNE